METFLLCILMVHDILLINAQVYQLCLCLDLPGGAEMTLTMLSQTENTVVLFL